MTEEKIVPTVQRDLLPKNQLMVLRQLQMETCNIKIVYLDSYPIELEMPVIFYIDGHFIRGRSGDHPNCLIWAIVF